MTKDYWVRHRNVSDWQAGSQWSHQNYDTGAVDIAGKVLESDPPRRLVLTWEDGKEARPPEPRVCRLLTGGEGIAVGLGDKGATERVAVGLLGTGLGIGHRELDPLIGEAGGIDPKTLVEAACI